MAEIFDQVDFRFLPNTTDAQRCEAMGNLKLSYGTITIAGVENPSFGVQPKSYCSIVLAPGDDPMQAAEALRKYPAIDPDSVRVHLKGSEEA